MKKPSWGSFLLIAVVVSGCATTQAPCKVGSREAQRDPHLVEGETLKVGEVYYFEGLMYSEFEDAGLILTSLNDRDALRILEDLKWQAFCFRRTKACSTSLDEIERSRGKRVQVARLKALVRFSGFDERSPSRSECRSGTFVVESLVSFHPLVEEPFPEE